MKKSRSYRVSLNRVRSDGNMRSIVFSLTEDTPVATVECDNLDDLLAGVEHFALQQSYETYASVAVADGGRKPPHFKDYIRDLFFEPSAVVSA